MYAVRPADYPWERDGRDHALSTASSISTCLALTAKYLMIKHNLLMMTNRTKLVPPAEFRFLCEYEIDEQHSSGNATFLLETLER